MPLFALLLVLFVGLPLLEIALLIEVGSRIGSLTTIALCVLTAAAGGMLVRSQGRAVWRALLRQLDLGRLPVLEAFHGICLLVAGALLMTPGFITDTFGFLLLVPAVRHALYDFLRRRIELGVEEGLYRAPPGEIELPYEVLDDGEMPPPGRGWGRR